MKKLALPICKDVNSLRKSISKQKKQSVGMVPTMGALHEGHLSLIRKAAQNHDTVIVTIFVNPIQFGPNEDLDAYPRRLVQDVELARSAGATLVFAPTKESFYSLRHQTTIANFELENLYCGEFRPGHFRGVLTVVTKLLLAGLPDAAYFGKKDYQQLYLIKRMVEDINIPVRVVGCPTKREKDGLARSSRNEYLSSGERSQSAQIYQVLKSTKEALKNNKKWNNLRKSGIKTLTNSGFDSVQYFELVSRNTLLPLKKFDEPAVLLLAAYMGKTRLIDNLEV